MPAIEMTTSKLTYPVPEELPVRTPVDSSSGNRVVTSDMNTRELQAVIREPVEEKSSQDSRNVSDKAAQTEELQKELQEKVGSFLKQYNVSLQFMVDKESGKQYFQLFDQVERKVIKQFPPEELIEMSRKLRKFQGFVVDEMA